MTWTTTIAVFFVQQTPKNTTRTIFPFLHRGSPSTPLPFLLKPSPWRPISCCSNPKSNHCSTARASRAILNASPSSAASETCRRTQKSQTPLMHEASTAITEDHLRLLQCLATEASVIEKTTAMPTSFTRKFQNQQNSNSSKP
ncbi:hypothetical protein VIGAN_08213900 [Vigna angularis var. angularis]|uniref:Uncharacterized protein n=1 Tax=Vigna angularis var. angularis TaxID=157739 RepID=A0A0S3SRI5_PHAAN|nr:hypothetical protein VIGAN_08213900 [Vigna angularis var. angularis]